MTLFENRFAPVTHSLGFVKADLGTAFEVLRSWRLQPSSRVPVYGEGEPLPNLRSPSVSMHRGALNEFLPLLEPLTPTGQSRELLVETAGGWTAYFDNGYRIQERFVPVGLLSRRLEREAVILTTIPDYGRASQVEPSMQFQLMVPHCGQPLDILRTVFASKESGVWRFGAIGPGQPFEDLENYNRRSKKDRLTSDLLCDYTRALGIEIEDPAGYGPTAMLLVSEGQPGMTFDQVQTKLGLHLPAATCDRTPTGWCDE